MFAHASVAQIIDDDDSSRPTNAQKIRNAANSAAAPNRACRKIINPAFNARISQGNATKGRPSHLSKGTTQKAALFFFLTLETIIKLSQFLIQPDNVFHIVLMGM